MNEESLLKKIRHWCEPTSLKSTLIGIGDDAAVIATSGTSIVFASDLSIENVHFNRNYSNAQDIGHKSIARVLSDVAAMGAEPVAVTISIALPNSLDQRQIDDFLEGFYLGAVALALETNCAIAGGDLSRADTPLVIDTAAVGEVRANTQAWLRSGAQAGDELFVTGELGGAAYALEQFQLGRGQLLAPAQSRKHLRPRPRLDIAASWPRIHWNAAKAAMDISDGLVQDAYRLCVASCTSLILDEPALRLASGSSIAQALTGGDDYELLLAVPAGADDSVHECLLKAGAYKIGDFSSRRLPDESEVFLRHASGAQKLMASPSCDPEGHDPFRDT